MSRIEVLGLPVDVLEQSGLLSAVEDLVEAGAGGRIAYLNVHVANTAASNPALAAILHSTDVVYCDGEGIRLAARWLGQELPERMTGADWIWDLAALAEKSMSEEIREMRETVRVLTDKADDAQREHDKIKTAVVAAAKVFGMLDARLADRNYVTGPNFSIGDIPAGCLVYRWLGMAIDRPSMPSLEAWYRRLTERNPYQTHIMIPIA